MIIEAEINAQSPGRSDVEAQIGNTPLLRLRRVTRDLPDGVTVFVKAEYFGLFHIPDNCLDLMRDDRHCPSIFVGYDGHVLLREGDRNGEITFPWHPTKLTEQHVQAIPKRLQKYPYPDSYSLLERIQWRLLLGRRKP